MIDTLKTIGISAVVVIVALLLTGNFGGSAIGGTYEITKQYFSAGVETDDLTVTDDTTFGSANATTSINFGKVCWKVTTAIGNTTYVTFTNAGTLATSTTNCN